MRHIPLLALGALLAAPAAAQERGCRDIRALLNVEGGEFQSVAWTMEAGVGTFLTVRGRRVALPAASGCDLNVDEHWTQFQCSWLFATSAEANAGYDGLLAQINACLAQPLRARAASAPGEETRILRQAERGFVSRRRETDVSLQLFEHSGEIRTDGRNRPFTLYLEAVIDIERVAAPEDVDF